jgi:2-polyprenyl-6-methoxyphenol hydroxylase-like FAD-dependent oxidoreductase
MLDAADVDVVIGGGGVAGALSAAALQQLGYRILVVEPGLHDERRLAGEVFHPPGVKGLAELGLLEPLRQAAAPIRGFALACGASDQDPIHLPYDEVEAHRTPGFGLEHALIRRRLLAAVSALPGVTVVHGQRIVAIDQSDPLRLSVGLADAEGTSRLRCRMVVAADGARSRMGRSVGIEVRQRRISTMFGYRIAAEHLATPDYGHVILGASAPVLLYPISRTEARVLFDVPHRDGRPARLEDCDSACAILPPALRAALTQARTQQPRMSVVAQSTVPDRLVQERVVLVGDAAGSCHPLTASGMTRCVDDALLLRDALAERPGDLRQALELYQCRRRWPQVTRLALAEALRDVFCGATPADRLVRRGLLIYCAASRTGRAATMALLSTVDGRPHAFLREVCKVMMRGVIAHPTAPHSLDPPGRTPLHRIVGGLCAVAFRCLRPIARTALRPLRRRQPAASRAL